VKEKESKLMTKCSLQFVDSTARTFLFGALFMCASNIAVAAPKIFTVTVDEEVLIERVYEERDISFTIVNAHTDDSFFVTGSVKGVVGLDPVTGRIMVDIISLNKSGMGMKAVGFVEDKDGRKGIDACTLWQTRMFEEAELCYTAKVEKGKQLTIVLDTDEGASMPVAAGQ